MMLNEILGLDKEKRNPKHLLLVAVSLLSLGIVGLFKALYIFIFLYAFLLVYAVVKWVIKTNMLYLATLLMVLVGMVKPLYFYITGSTRLDLLWSIIFYLGVFINLVVLASGIYRASKGKSYIGNILYFIINVMVVGSMGLISLTYTLDYTVANHGQMESTPLYFLYVFLTYLVFYVIVTLSSRVSKDRLTDVKLFND